MMELSQETIDLLQITVLCVAAVFVIMLLMHGLSHLLENLFKG